MNRKEKNINLTNIKDDLEDLYFSLTKIKMRMKKRQLITHIKQYGQN